MQDTRSKLQILAPAGSAEQLVAAVNNGCDAVYLGLDSFNARMKAPNFSVDNLAQWIDYCHLFGVKVYVAINTSIKNDEFAHAVELLKTVYLLNADGVIVTDLALMRIAGTLPKPFDVVASTQLNVHDKFGAEYVARCGATTVVCARECSYGEISEIASVGINVECFLHGAMCVSQSGQCLFSSIVGGNSGNRGLCAQPCRKYYFAEGDADTRGYLLSAHDICSLDTAGKLVDCGVTTFKIEGRNRRPEYAGITSRVYGDMFDNNFVPRKDDYAKLAEMFNRSMSANNYLTGGNSEIIYKTAQNHTGVPIGVVRNSQVITQHKLCKGDGLKVLDNGKEICGGIALESGTSCVRAQFSGRVSDGMQVCRTTSVELCNEVLDAKRKLPASIRFVAKVGCKPCIIAACNNISVTVEGEFTTEKAISKETSHNEIAVQLQKSGKTHYTITDIIIESDEIFIAKSQLNALRRKALDSLTAKLVGAYNSRFAARRQASISVEALLSSLDNLAGYDARREKYNSNVCYALCYNEQELEKADKYADDLIYKPSVLNADAFKAAAKHNAFVDLPSFADLQFVSRLLNEIKVGLVCNNVGHVALARTFNVNYIAGGGLNIFNDYIAAEFADAHTFVYSRELTLNEIGLFNVKSGIAFVDGKIPLMQLCHCPYKVAFNCTCESCKASSKLVLQDEMGNRFDILRRQAERCVFELINGNKLSVANKLKHGGRYLIDFDEEVLKHYVDLNSGVTSKYVETKPYTKGRLYDKIN